MARCFSYPKFQRDVRTAEEAFQWQLPSPSTPGAVAMSHDAYEELNHELRANAQRQYQNCGADSVHTDFQEHIEATEMIPPTWEPSGSSHQTLPGRTRADSFTSQWPADPPEYAPGYMGRNSPFSFESPPVDASEMSFMEWYPKGHASLTFQNEDGTLVTVQQINVWMVEERCPVLAAAFEESRSGLQLFLETLTSATAAPFLRYLYTGTYAVTSPNSDVYEDVPTSVLLHCQMYRLADIYDLSELKSQAYVNVLRQCEFGCSSPEKPIDLCAAIRLVYEHLRGHENLIDALVNYCVSCFIRHKLAEDEKFKELAYELRPFHQELCRNSMNREFENESKSLRHSELC